MAKATKSKKCPHAFWERNSWYHRTKTLQPDYTVKYGKIGGFKTDLEAETSYVEHMKEFERQLNVQFISQDENTTLKNYLIYWFETLFSERIKSSTKSLTAYVLYHFLIPHIDDKVILRLVSTDYINRLLRETTQYCDSAPNKSREVLYIAMQEAVSHRILRINPVKGSDTYPRKTPEITILSKEQIKKLLRIEKSRNWFLEVLLGLYCGLRKGEILGLKFSDFDFEKRTLSVQRQLVTDVELEDGGYKVIKYTPVLRDPKSENGIRTMKIPEIILVEVEKRRKRVEKEKEEYGEGYMDFDYITCQKNGMPRGRSSFNTELNRICKRNGLPHITVHGLRHMFATSLLERGVSLPKVSSLLGHGSINTTFEYYVGIMEETEKIIAYINDEFQVEE